MYFLESLGLHGRRAMPRDRVSVTCNNITVAQDGMRSEKILAEVLRYRIGFNEP
jgi:hypothetical protein